MTKDKLKNLIARCNLERGTWSDNLAIALMCYFDGHKDQEDLGTDEYGDDIWAKEKMEQAIDYIPRLESVV